MKNVKKDALMASFENFHSAKLNNDASRNVNGGGRWTYKECDCDGLDWVGSGPPPDIITIRP